MSIVNSSLWSMKVFVESLDRAFENVCELDLVFHFDDVCANLLYAPHSNERHDLHELHVHSLGASYSG